MKTAQRIIFRAEGACQRAIMQAWLIVASGLVSFPGDRDVQASWPFQQTLGPFRLHADFVWDSQDPLMAELTALPADIQGHLGIAAPHEPIDVYLFARREIYQQYMRRHFPRLEIREAMFVKSNSPGNVFACLGPQFAVDLRHECTHAVLHAALPLVPLWLDEGLAEYFEMAPQDRADRHPSMAVIRRKAHLGWQPSLTRLEQVRHFEAFGQREYQESWAYVHWMLHGPPAARQALVEFLRDLQQHRPPGRLSERLEQRISNPPQAVAAHFREWGHRGAAGRKSRENPLLAKPSLQSF